MEPQPKPGSVAIGAVALLAVMRHSPRKLYKVLAGLAGLTVVLVVLLLLVVSRIPSAQDARVSEQIRVEFEQAISAYLPPEKHVTIIGSPRRNATIVIVKGGALTQEEKQRVTIQAEQIGQKRDHRPVKIVFQD